MFVCKGFVFSVLFVFFSSFGIAPKEAKGLENFNPSGKIFGQPRGLGVGGRMALGEPSSWVVGQSGIAALAAAFAAVLISYRLLSFGMIAFEEYHTPNSLKKRPHKQLKKLPPARLPRTPSANMGFAKKPCPPIPLRARAGQIRGADYLA